MKNTYKKITELLTFEELNSLEIAKRLDISVSNCCSYLSNLLKDKKIERITNTIPYLYKTVDLKFLMKYMYRFIVKRCSYGSLTKQENETFEYIKDILNQKWGAILLS